MCRINNGSLTVLTISYHVLMRSRFCSSLLILEFVCFNSRLAVSFILCSLLFVSNVPRYWGGFLTLRYTLLCNIMTILPAADF